MSATSTLNDLASDLRRAVADLETDGPLVVTDRDAAVAVMLSPGQYQRLMRELELLRRLALGELECAAEVGHDLDEVVADGELLLDEN